MAVLPKVNSSSLSKRLFFQKKAFNFSFGGGRRGLFEDRVEEEREEVRAEETQVTLSSVPPRVAFLSFFFLFFFFSPPSLFLAGSFVQAAFYSLTAALNISHIRSFAKLCASGHIALKPLVCQLQSASQMATCLLWVNIKRSRSLESS